MNRFTQLTPAQFNPMSWEEIASVPLAKRQQHDNQQQAMAELESTLAQINSLNQHEPQTKAIQDYYRNQIENLSGRLASEGVSDDLKGELLSLNSKYKADLSPQGALGKIQGAYDTYNQNYKTYLETAPKEWASQDIERGWQEFANNYTGYNSENKIESIGSFGAPNKVALMDKLKDVKNLLGDQVTKEIAAGNYSIQPMSDGSLAIINRSGRRIESSNIENIKAAQKMLNQELIDPNSEWRKSIDFENLDINSVANQMNQGLTSMVETDVKDTRRENLSIRGFENSLTTSDINNPNIPSVTEPVVEYNNKRNNLGSMVSKLGTPKEGKVKYSPLPGTGAVVREPDTIYTKDDLTNSQKEEYDLIYDSMLKSGIIGDNIDKYSIEANKLITDHINKISNFSFSTKILKPTAVDNDLQKPLMFTPKKGFDMEKHIKQELSTGTRRHLYTKDSLEQIDYEDLDVDKIEYVGMVSPDNVLETNDDTLLNDNSLVIPHIVQVTNDDGEVTEYYMDRDSQEMKKPEFLASKTIKNVLFKSKKVADMVVDYNSPELKQLGVKNIDIRYNSISNTYDLKLTSENDDSTSLMGVDSSAVQKGIYRLFSSLKQ